MNVTYLLWALLIGVVSALVVRLGSVQAYKAWFRQGPMWDAAFHYAVVMTLKRKHGAYDGVESFLMRDGPDAYPILFHRFAALFPARTLWERPFLPNLVLHAASFGAALAYASYINGTFLHLSPAFEVAFAALYLGSVSNLVFNGNAILYISLSERELARLSCSWYFLTMAIGMMFHDPASLAFAVIAGAVAGVSSMFGRQAVAFTTPLAALLAADWLPMLVLGAAVIVATLFDGRYFIRGVIQMVEFSRAYLAFTKRSNWVRPALSRYVEWRRLLDARVPWGTRVEELLTCEPTRMFFHNPEVAAFLLVAATASVSSVGTWAQITLATLIVYVATSTRWLNHLGEAARYVEFNLGLGLPFFVAYTIVAEPWPGGLAVVALLAAWNAFFVVRYRSRWRRQSFADRDVLAGFLKPLALGAGSTVFPVPFTLGGSICVRTPGSRALMYQGSAVTRNLYAKFCEEVPMLKRDWKPLCREYGVTHVIALADVLPMMKSYLGWEYDFRELTRVAASGQFVAFAVPDKLRREARPQ